MNRKIMERIPKNQIISIYTSIPLGAFYDFLAGFPVAFDDNYLILNCIDVYGEDNGFIMLSMSDIIRIDLDSEYEHKLIRLYQQKQKKTVQNEWKRFKDLDFSVMLDYAYQKHLTARIEFDDENVVCGWVENTQDYCIDVMDVFECSPDQGKSYFSLDKIAYVWINDRRARDAAFVYQMMEKDSYET